MFHGSGGRIPVKDIQLSSVNSVIQRTFAELGVKTRDVNGRNMYGRSRLQSHHLVFICVYMYMYREHCPPPTGYLPGQATVRGGTRWGTYKGFIRRAMRKENLFVLTEAVAQKVGDRSRNGSLRPALATVHADVRQCVKFF